MLNLAELMNLIHIKITMSIILSIITYSLSMRYTKKILKKSKINESSHAFLKSLIKIILIVVLAMIVISIVFNIDITNFIAAFSVLGLAVSFAVKDSLANLASGILILLSKPFENNDFISINDVSGYIIETDLIHTKLKTIDNKIIYIPNNEISKNIITNYSKQENRRLDIIFPIAYDADIDKAKEIILQVLKKSDYYTDHNNPEIVVESLGESSINIMLKCYCKNKDYHPLRFFLNENVKKEFDKQKIKIPFKTLEVNIKSQE